MASDIEETMRRMGIEVTDNEVGNMLADYDLPTDGRISFDQFKLIMLADKTPQLNQTPSAYNSRIDQIATPLVSKARVISDFG
jgi:hypothetical protein